MKKFLLFFGLTTSLAFQSTAAETEKGNYNNEVLKNQIVNRIEVPNFIHKNSSANDYKAVVKILPDGSILPEKSFCENREVKTYVEEELQNIRLTQNLPGEATRIFLVIRFKVL